MTCFDRTGNQIKAKDNTNVVRLFSLLELTDPEMQVAYYDPGVGTLGSSRSWTPWGQAITRVLGLAFGMGLRENLGEAHAYLVSHYEDGHHIYISASAAAGTPHAPCAACSQLGLLRDGSQTLVPYAVKLFTGNSPAGIGQRSLEVLRVGRRLAVLHHVQVHGGHLR